MSDLISRKDAIEATWKAFLKVCEIKDKAGWQNTEPTFAVMEAMSDISRLPSADRPKGKWINESDMDFSCSVCGQMATVAFEHEGYPMINYCPNCGAKMVDSEKPSVNQMRGNTDD